MKKLITLIALFTFFSLATTPALKANNFNGSELTYICLGGNAYLVTYTFYTDCSSIPGPNSVNINYKCQSNSAFNFTTNVNKDTNTGQEITMSCPYVNTSCKGGSGSWFGMREYIYQVTVTLPPCNSWEISVSGCCRAPVTTLTNPSNYAHYALALLNNLNAPCNSSPTFDNTPQLVVRSGQDLNLFYGALEADGDSLVYSLVPAKTSISAGINYITGLSATNFLYATAPKGITLNPQTGDISFNATQNLTTIFCLKVDEYRNINGIPTLIGTVHRDLQLKVVYSNNIAPSLSGMDFNQTHTYNPSDTIYNYHHCMDGSPITFDINGFDPDTFNSSSAGQNHIFNIGWNNGIPGGYFNTFHNGTDSAYANFNWLPDSFMVGKTYYFSAYIQDSACPYNGYQSYTYEISLHPKQEPFSLGNDTVIDMNQALFLALPSGYDNYLWSTGDTTQVLILTSMLAYTNPIIGSVNKANGCLMSDTINVTFSVGFNNDINRPEIKIYPNPIKDVLYVDLNKNYAKTYLEIIDCNGRLIKKAAFPGSKYELKTLDKLSSGIYFIKLHNNELNICRKFVKQ